MTDLFTTAPPPPARIGQGNGLFLAHLAAGIPDATMRANFRAGLYPDLHTASVPGWRKLAGRTTNP